MIKEFKVALIGCGNIAPMHLESVQMLHSTKIVAVCDNKLDRAQSKAKQYQCSYYADYKKMLDNEDIDVVHICTPHYLHAPMTIYAANKGVNILTEKPMSISLQDADDMISACANKNVALGVIFQNRYNAGSLLIKDTLKSGALGKILSAKLMVTWDRSDEYYSKSDWKGTWEMEGGGVLIDQAIHTLDLLRWFVDSPIDYIDANISNRAHERIEVEDSAEGVIKYKNGVVTGFYTVNYYSYDAPVEIEIDCEYGLVRLVSDKATIRFNDGREISADRDPRIQMSYGEGIKSYWGVSHFKQIKEYYDSLTNGHKPTIDGLEARKTQQMICAIYQSGKEKRKISL